MELGGCVASAAAEVQDVARRKRFWQPREKGVRDRAKLGQPLALIVRRHTVIAVGKLRALQPAIAQGKDSDPPIQPQAVDIAFDNRRQEVPSV